MSDEDELAAHAEEQALDEVRTPRVFTAFRVAAVALRDAELALQAAQVAYREALIALNKAVAPVP